jgi:quinol monooxygenase YgiN
MTLPLPAVLAAPSRFGTEIAITGKWVPAHPGTFFRRSEDTAPMRDEWHAIHAEAAAHPGILSTEIDHGQDGEAVLVHHVFRDADALVDYFGSTATGHMEALMAVARPEHHLVRGLSVPVAVREAIQAKGVDATYGEHRYGFVKNDYRRPDLDRAVMVTAKWTALPSVEGALAALDAGWRQVGEDAHELEEGLLRFEVYAVPGEDALIVHEAFRDTAELRFHLTRGTAAMHKQALDRVAAPECYFFRGPVSWDIRTYSKFMKLPATYTRGGVRHTRPGGSMAEGLVD